MERRTTVDLKKKQNNLYKNLTPYNYLIASLLKQRQSRHLTPILDSGCLHTTHLMLPMKFTFSLQCVSISHIFLTRIIYVLFTLCTQVTAIKRLTQP